jgi:hypothetical protein
VSGRHGTTTRTVVGIAALGSALAVTSAQGQPAPTRPLPELGRAPASQRVTGVTYCRGRYVVMLSDGMRREFLEYDLSFKIDTTNHGPPAGAPALIAAGRVGDRGIAVFASADELTRGIRRAPDCREGVQ